MEIARVFLCIWMLSVCFLPLQIGDGIWFQPQWYTIGNDRQTNGKRQQRPNCCRRPLPISGPTDIFRLPRQSVRPGNSMPSAQLNRGSCTATLITPTRVLTAAHCVSATTGKAEGCDGRAAFTLRSVFQWTTLTQLSMNLFRGKM